MLRSILRTRFHFLALVVALVLTAPLVAIARPLDAGPEDRPDPAHDHDAHDGDATRHLAIFVTSGLSGHLMHGEHTIAELVAALRTDAASARAEGFDVVVFDAGGTLVPYAESRADGGATMASVLRALDAEAFAPSPMDFTLGRERIVPFADAVGFPVLRSFATDDADLRTLAGHARVGPEDLALEIRSVFDPVFVGDLQATGIDAERFRVLPETEFPETEGTAMERVGGPPPDLRILVVHSRGFGGDLVDRDLTWSLVRHTPEEGSETPVYDLIVDPNMGHDITLRRETARGPIFLVGRELDTSEPWTYARLDLELVRDVDGDRTRWRPEHLDMHVWRHDDETPQAAAKGPELQALDAEIEDAFRRFRSDWGVPLPEPADRLDRRELERFTLAALREHADAEIAILNRGVLRPVAEEHWIPPITRETVLRLLTLDQNVAVGYLSGTELMELAEESHRRRDVDGEPTGSALHFLGLEFDEETDPDTESDLESFEVNGRPLYPDDLYRVVTNTFLTSGGDDYPTLAEMEAELLPRTAGDADAVALEARADVVLPRLEEASRPFYDPAARPLWRYGVEKLALDATGVDVSADAAYEDVADSRASASDASQARLDLRLFADQDWPALRWQNRLRVRYGVVETDEVDELADDLRLEAGAVLHRAALWEGSAWEAQPFLSLQVDTELRRNVSDDGVRLPRQLEQSLSLGLDWDLENWPRLRVGALYRIQDDVEDADRWGWIGEGWFHLDADGLRPGVDVEFLAERVEDRDAAISRFDLDLRLAFEIGEDLFLTPGLDYYLYRDDRLPGTAEYRALKLGIVWSWIDKVQR